MAKLTRSERQHGKEAVPIDLQKQRILFSMSQLPKQYSAPTSCLAYMAFPDYRFRSPQGAALAISKTARMLCDEKLLRHGLRGYEITDAGRAAIAPAPAREE